MQTSQKEDFKLKHKLVEKMYATVIDSLKGIEVDLAYSEKSDWKWFTITLPCVDNTDYDNLARLMIFELTKNLPIGENNKKLYITRKQYSTQIDDVSNRQSIYHKFIMRACWI